MMEIQTKNEEMPVGSTYLQTKKKSTYRPLQRKVKNKGKPWSLRRLQRQGHCSKSLFVWIALHDMALQARSRVLTPTHDILSLITGIKRTSTLSLALTTLHNAGWITCKAASKGAGLDYVKCLWIKLRRQHAKTFAMPIKAPPVPETEPITFVSLDVVIPRIIEELKTCKIGDPSMLLYLFTTKVDYVYNNWSYRIHATALIDSQIEAIECDPSFRIFKKLFIKHMKLPPFWPIIITHMPPDAA